MKKVIGWTVIVFLAIAYITALICAYGFKITAFAVIGSLVFTYLLVWALKAID